MSDFRHAMKFAVPISITFIALFQLIRITLSLFAASWFGITVLFSLLAGLLILIAAEMRDWDFVDPVWKVLEP